MEEVEQILKLVVLAGAAVGALGMLRKHVLIPLAAFMRRLSAAAHVVLYELQPNGGMSMKDDLKAILRRLDAVERWQEKHDEDRAA